MRALQNEGTQWFCEMYDAAIKQFNKQGQDTLSTFVVSGQILSTPLPLNCVIIFILIRHSNLLYTISMESIEQQEKYPKIDYIN